MLINKRTSNQLVLKNSSYNIKVDIFFHYNIIRTAIYSYFTYNIYLNKFISIDVDFSLLN